MTFQTFKTNEDERKFYVKRNAMQAELDKLAKELDPEGGLRDTVHLYEKGSLKEIGVNWCCMGTIAAEDTVRFAQLLTRAAEMCEEYNKEVREVVETHNLIKG